MSDLTIPSFAQPVTIAKLYPEEGARLKQIEDNVSRILADLRFHMTLPKIDPQWWGNCPKGHQVRLVELAHRTENVLDDGEPTFFLQCPHCTEAISINSITK